MDHSPRKASLTTAYARFAHIRGRMRLPLIAAPMFRVSGVDLVVAACMNGLIGAFPTANCRTPEELGQWLAAIRERLRAHEDTTGTAAAAICPNLIVHASNKRLADDLATVLAHAPEILITSVGSPAGVVRPLHDAGAFVFADVATIRHAERALAAGADGLVLLTAGAGGQTGWLNPFAFVRAVRQFFTGPIVLAGGISDGHALHAAAALGCDLAYMGTRFIATHESLAPPAYKEMLVAASADDVLLTRAFTGLQTNMLRPSIIAAGLDPDTLPERGMIDVAKDINLETQDERPRRWRDIWSAGHSTSGVRDILSVETLIAQTEREYRAASSVPAQQGGAGEGA
jgi:nitronate monooxygenase